MLIFVCMPVIRRLKIKMLTKKRNTTVKCPHFIWSNQPNKMQMLFKLFSNGILFLSWRIFWALIEQRKYCLLSVSNTQYFLFLIWCRKKWQWRRRRRRPRHEHIKLNADSDVTTIGFLKITDSYKTALYSPYNNRVSPCAGCAFCSKPFIRNCIVVYSLST